MTHPLRVSALLCILALGPPCLAHAQVIPSHAVPEAVGALVMPSVARALQPCARGRDSLRKDAIMGGARRGITMLAFGTLASVVSVGPAENGSGCASETLSSRPWDWASLPEHVLVSMRCWNDLHSAPEPWQTIGRWQSSKRGPASHRGTRTDGGTSEAFASGVTCIFTTARPSIAPVSVPDVQTPVSSVPVAHLPRRPSTLRGSSTTS
jgi:hypothetical protein